MGGEDMAKCPSCKATVEDGILKCPNCRKQLKWHDGEPVLTVGQVIGDIGKSLTIIVWVPILIAIFFYLISSYL
jgi:hypothetical protein